MSHKKHTAEFKARVAREAIEGKLTLSELSLKFGVHPNMVSRWKAEALDGLVEIFSTKKAKKDRESEIEKETLFKKIGELEVENDFLKKKSIELGIYPKKRFGQ